MAADKAFGQFNQNGKETTAVAAGTATDTVIKAEKGLLCRIVVTATDSNPMMIYDHATEGTGKVIGALPANPAVGSSYTFMMPAENGIVVDGHADNPGVTISWS